MYTRAVKKGDVSGYIKIHISTVKLDIWNKQNKNK